MKTVDFTQHLLNVQSELFRFAFKLTADREEANDLLQETSLKALDNEEKFTPDTNFKGLQPFGVHLHPRLQGQRPFQAEARSRPCR